LTGQNPGRREGPNVVWGGRRKLKSNHDNWDQENGRGAPKGMEKIWERLGSTNASSRGNGGKITPREGMKRELSA